MFSVRIIMDDGTDVIVPVKICSEGFDKADELGAHRLVDIYGEKFVKLQGEWYGYGSIRQPKSIAGNGEKRQ
jgi:hypothetical protein